MTEPFVQGELIKIGVTQRRIFMLDNRHVVRDPRVFKSSADRYYGCEHRLKPEIEEWLAEQGIPFTWKGGYGLYSLYIDDNNKAMLFKLTWM